MKKINLATAILLLCLTANICWSQTNPIAKNDTSMVVLNNTLTFEVLENDNLNGELIQFQIKELPEHGMVRTNEDGSISYRPKKNVCQEMDHFTYVIKNEHGESEGTVYLEILCETLTFFSGFSAEAEEPDNNFIIKGAEQFPNNSLSVFNSWGNEVFYTSGYQNDWNGQTDEGQLTNEMCYYVFEDGEGNMFSGYVLVE